jgi:FKBP-type peptidyl-prolyl cis-trans isomerase
MRHRMPIRRLLPLALVPLALAVAACGGTEESTADRYAAQAEQEARQRASQPQPETKPVVAEKAEPSAGERDIDKKPEIPEQTGEPPKELVARDLIEGEGEAVKEGDTVFVDYVGVLFKGGKEFDSSWGEGKEDFSFTVGDGQVIDGWEQGVVGMKPGGRRQLVIPPDLAYGEAGQPPSIPANATLVFDIDLRKVEAGGGDGE